MGSGDTIADTDGSTTPKAVDQTEEEARGGTMPALKERREETMSVTRPPRDVRDARLGRVRMKHPKERPGSAARVLTGGRPMTRDVIASVQRRSVPARRPAAASADRAMRRWRWRAALLIALLSASAIVWPTSDPSEDAGVGQGGPVIAPNEEAIRSGHRTSDTPIESPGAPFRPAGGDGDGDDPAASSTTSTLSVEERAASEASLAAVLVVIRRQERSAGKDFSGVGTTFPDPWRSARTEENASALAASDRAATSPAPGFESRIVVHLAAGEPLETADAVIRALIDAGFERPELRRVDFPISATNVRFFFPNDRLDAERIDLIVAEALGRAAKAGPRDFTHYRPLPVDSTIEIWLADRQHHGSRPGCCGQAART